MSAPKDVSGGGTGQPAAFAFAITPSDVTDLEFVTRGVWIGGAGTLKVTMLNGGTITFVGIAAGTLLPIRVTKVFFTGTSATDILGLT